MQVQFASMHIPMIVKHENHTRNQFLQIIYYSGSAIRTYTWRYRPLLIPSTITIVLNKKEQVDKKGDRGHGIQNQDRCFDGVHACS